MRVLKEQRLFARISASATAAAAATAAASFPRLVNKGRSGAACVVVVEGRLKVWVHVKRRSVTFTAASDERHQLRVCPFPTCI